MGDDIADQIVAAARGWIGTPYVHGASLRGVGADCLGLLRGVWREVLGGEPEAIAPYSPHWAETGDAARLAAGLARRLQAVALDRAAPGDVALLQLIPGGPAKHVGVLAEDGDRAPSLIHAYGGRGVVESALGPALRRRIAGVFRFVARGR